MTNEDKILELLLGMQKDIVGLKQDVGGLKQDMGGLKQDLSDLKQDVSGLKQGQERLETKTDAIDAKMDKLADIQVADIYTLTKLTYDKTTKLDSKLIVLNKRLFEQEAEIEWLKLAK